MSDQEQMQPAEKMNTEEAPNRGPNLTVIYSLIVVAMLAAIVIAAFIVLPFYHRR